MKDTLEAAPASATTFEIPVKRAEGDQRGAAVGNCPGCLWQQRPAHIVPTSSAAARLLFDCPEPGVESHLAIGRQPVQRTRKGIWCACAAAAVCLAGITAAAQSPTPAPDANSSGPFKVKLISAYRFHLALARFAPSETQFRWDTHFGGDVTIVDWSKGYINLLADLETIVGSEFRTIDPNQADFTLDGSMGIRRKRVTVGFLFHHVSRHVIDRSKMASVDWNVAGLQADAHGERGNFRIDGYVSGSKIVKKTSVDYDWELKCGAGMERDVSRRLALRIAVDADLMKTDAAIAGRSGFADRGIELVARVQGRAGALELFLRGERRNDPSVLDFARRSWALLGFRFVRR